LQGETSSANVPNANPQAQTAKTYLGTTTIGSTYLKEFKSGEIIKDGITLVIDKDGLVSGSIETVWHNQGTPVEGCVTDVTMKAIGILSGTLTEKNNTVEIAFLTENKFIRSGCPVGNETITDAWISSAQIQLSGNKITGTIAEGFTFEAIQQ
jgi:hypothetical protein